MNRKEQIEVVGIDLAKYVFQIHARDASGNVVMEQKMSRDGMRRLLSSIPSCQVGMEACGTANYWGQEIRKMNHRVKLMAPQHVSGYRQGNKNDRNDAAGITEATGQPHVRSVAIKEPWQQDILITLRVRNRMIRHRTAIKNELRAVLQEYGIVFKKGWRDLHIGVEKILGGYTDVRPAVFDLVEELYGEIQVLNERVGKLEQKIDAWAGTMPAAKRLIEICGIGPITSVALVAIAGDVRNFRNGRHFAAFLGLVPSHSGTGGKVRLGAISKRGDSYMRELLIHCGRSVLTVAARHEDQYMCRWALEVRKRRGFNKAAVAVAHKLARQSWAVLKKCEQTSALQ